MDWKERLVAHRGYPAAFPENSLLGLEVAIRAGARWVEFDLQLTADGVPILLHDVTLDRVSDRSGSVFETRFAELEDASAGEPDRFSDRFGHVGFTRLSQVVDALAAAEAVQAMVEIKPESVDHHGAGKVIDHVVPELDAIRGRFVLISYHQELLEAARRLHDCPIGWIVDRYGPTARAIAESLDPDYLVCNRKKLPRDRPWWPGSWHWVVYTANRARLAQELLERGAHLVETDRIGELLDDG